MGREGAVSRVAASTLAVVLALLLAGPRPARAEGWRTRAPMPTARSGAASAVIGGQMCVVGGYYTQDNRPVLVTAHECFDPKSNTWSKRAPLPSPRSGAFAVALDEQMYVLGGISQGQITSDLNQRYDPKTDLWETLPPVPTSRVVPVAASLGGRIFVIGGEREAPDFKEPYMRPLRACEAYTPATRSWSKCSPLPSPRPRPAVAVAAGRILVLGGGEVYRDPVTRLAHAFDPASDSWQPIASLPTARTAAFAAFLGGRVHVFGGYVDDANAKPEPFRFLNANEAWDPTTNTWAAFQGLPEPRGGFAGGVIDGKVYLAGGFNPERRFLTRTDEYTPPKAR